MRKIRVAGTKEAKSPHKYVLLLTLVDFFERDASRENRFHFSSELHASFLSSWRKYLNSDPAYPESALDYPYYHLSTSGLWVIAPRLEAKDKYQTYADPKNNLRFTGNRIRETIEFAYVRSDLCSLLRDQEGRAALRDFLLGLVAAAPPDTSDSLSVPLTSRFRARASSYTDHIRTYQ